MSPELLVHCSIFTECGDSRDFCIRAGENTIIEEQRVQKFINQGEFYMDCISEIRYYRFMSGVLAYQQYDPFCRMCRAFTNSVRALREGIAGLEGDRASEVRSLPEEMTQLLVEAKKTLAGLHLDPEAAGQKKAGNCKLREGVCFVKSSKALIRNLG
jgi:hypothetical protein